jgi:hypothetical protein
MADRRRPNYTESLNRHSLHAVVSINDYEKIRMRKYEKVKETVERKRLVETTCDLCGVKAQNGDWDSSSYSVNEVEVEVKVRQKDGSAYPDGGWGTELMVDICPKCFKETLIPFLREKGAKIEEREWDF